MGLKIKNVIVKQVRELDNLIEGIDVIHRPNENGEDYITVTGTKPQINQYLQNKPILSDRLRTLNNLPKYRIINTTKERIY